ncbi:MAG: hypothetical protein M1131_00195 [Actinobacteria bacterium]|nr:hypothetical protein [Actinomycetota bacterium]
MHADEGADQSVVESSDALTAMALLPTGGGPLLGPEPVSSGPLMKYRWEGQSESLVSGLRRASPLAIAGVLVNGANVLVTLAVARLLTPRQYGSLVDLLGIFLVISMPGSAVVVGVVRKVTAWLAQGELSAVIKWLRRVRWVVTMVFLLILLGSWSSQSILARLLGLPDPAGVVAILGAGGVWLVLSVERGIIQSNHSYGKLASNLAVEGGARTTLTLGLVAGGLGVGGAALGLFLAETMATLHAKWLVNSVKSDLTKNLHEHPNKTMPSTLLLPMAYSPANQQATVKARSDNQTLRATPSSPTLPSPLSPPSPPSPLVSQRVPATRRWEFAIDLTVALSSLALLAFLQNVDVMVVGREDPRNAGPYAAISVMSKALVFGAVALGGFLLPEAAAGAHHGRPAVKQLLVVLSFLAIPAVSLLILALVFSKEALALLFGSGLEAGSGYFAALAAAMVCLSITVLLTNYLLGVGWRWVVILLGAAAGCAFFLLSKGGGHFQPTVTFDLLVQAGLAVALIAVFLVIHFVGYPYRVA